MRSSSALPHVLWLGGSACAGKTTVSRLLAARSGFPLYSCDDRFEEHRRRADPARHPAFLRLADRPPEDLWTEPPAVQAEELIRFYEDELEMVIGDLRTFPGPVLAEGAGLLPERVAEVILDPHRAAWLIADPAFRRRAYPERGPFVAELLSRRDDPEATFQRWMERDDLLARRLEEDARRLGFAVLPVDGSREPEEIAEELAHRFEI